jgi:hypothetical protein
LREWHQPLALQTRKEWTALLGDLLAVVVLDGEDHKHSWYNLAVAYKKAFEDGHFRPEARRRPVLFVALRSMGQVEHMVEPIVLDFLKPQDRARFEREQSITQYNQLKLLVCQGSFLEQARLEVSIKDFLESKIGCAYG